MKTEQKVTTVQQWQAIKNQTQYRLVLGFGVASAT